MASSSNPPADPRRRRFSRVVVIVLVGVLAAGGAAGLLSRPSDDTSLGTVDGITVSAFDGGGGRIDLASFAGRPLVLNYWASWCVFCIDEMPDFQDVYERVSDRVEFLGINLQDTPEEAARLAEVTGVRYPLAIDATGEAFEALGGAFGMPVTYFVDEEGTILERFTGPLTAEQLGAKLDEHFDT